MMRESLTQDEAYAFAEVMRQKVTRHAAGPISIDLQSVVQIVVDTELMLRGSVPLEVWLAPEEPQEPLPHPDPYLWESGT